MTEVKTRILVADDERNIRKNLAMVLETAGYEVETAADGEEALRKSRESVYDMAFLDIEMPKLDGLSLLRQIKGLKPRTAVVIVSAYGTVSRAVEAMKLGAVDLIEKPYEPEAILLLCQEILQRRNLAAGGSVDDLLRMAGLARTRGARLDERAYLKNAMLRDVSRPEPYFLLGRRAEEDGDPRQAIQYYFMAYDADRNFEPVVGALRRLGKLPASHG
ncbi:MAG: response regulator [Alphaproteobacteria bacterium]